MSSINGPRIFYFLPELYDVSCKAQCLCSVCESLQSDAYNVYMYLDNELMDIEHLCCLTHARAKFKYANDQGSLQTRIFLEQIANLYGMEDTYRREKLTADEIYRRRNDVKTTETIEKKGRSFIVCRQIRMRAEANLCAGS